MNKKALAVGLMTIIMMVCSAFFSYADGGLEITSTYPEDGQTNTSIENVGVKLYFNNAVDSDEAVSTNTKLVKITGEDGKKIPVKVLAQGRELLVLGDSTSEDYNIENNSYYTLTIDGAFVDNDGNTLGEDASVKFKTFNQKVNNFINMAMMFVMFGAIMVMTMRQTTGQTNEKKTAKEEDTGTFNPYREAKKTGKSVDEIVAEENARKEKAAKKAARQDKKAAAIREKLEEDMNLSEELPYVYKVKRPRRISEAGSTHGSGRGIKKEAETKRTQSKTRQKSAGKKSGKKK